VKSAKQGKIVMKLNRYCDDKIPGTGQSYVENSGILALHVLNDTA
jgi:hypothetical protein